MVADDIEVLGRQRIIWVRYSLLHFASERESDWDQGNLLEYSTQT